MSTKQIKSTITYKDDPDRTSVGFYDWDSFNGEDEKLVRSLLEVALIDSVTLETNDATWKYEVEVSS